ncbi:MAG TPA: bifunctional diaminohydroxyphosphoribosylaminopyrimidine deaminase/5-amino-6-(5-phosphoribosylamino)uracil reductase RibD [Thermodesulfobacteriota bacterium]|nr:bifunctional diaminohydroxyphosphoribosylaminopyrimidine deaminase/5-amino-6-(5-phosphoribosylamino)uracil reductase RibD [Thermodesulfobacteriota bacterium]
MNIDEIYMRMALSLAKKGIGGASPNPMVGAVVVKNGKIVGKGYHKRYGEAHAEVNALNDAGPKAKGATLYLNLEPCCHFGKTPPCTDSVIKARIKRVVAGMTDPNPKVSGKGFDILKKAGIEVSAGILEEECRSLNEGFIKRIKTGRPFVILKIAASLDGKTATRNKESKWITSEASRRSVHRLRGRVDAIMTGIGTVVADDPLLTPRVGRIKKAPLRVVVDSLLKVPDSAKVVDRGTLFVATERAPDNKVRLLESSGAKVIRFPSKDGKVDLTALMSFLGMKGINTVMVESGPELSASLLMAGLVDKVLFFYAPKIIGGTEAPGMVGGDGIERLSDAINLRDIRIKRFGEDIMIEGYVHRNN